MRFVLQRTTRRNPCRCTLHVGQALQRAIGPIHGNSPGTPRPEICSRATATHSELRIAYLGGVLVELAGAMIALVFVRSDSMEQRKRSSPRAGDSKAVRGDQPIASRP